MLSHVPKNSVVSQFEKLKKIRVYKNCERIFKKQFQASKYLTFYKNEKRSSKLFLKIQRTDTKPVIDINLV